MKNKLFFITTAIAFLLTLVLFSCQKDLSIETGGTILSATVGTPILPATPVTGSVSGIVTDENDAPVANAPVTVGGSTYLTNAKGFFNTGNHTLDKYISTVQVSVPGYFKAIRSFCANPTRNYVAIKLVPKTLAGSFSSSSTGSITLPNGSQINFTAGSIVNKSTGAPYTGNVKVYSAYIDPTATDISAKVPGSFIGQDNTNMYALASAGMIAVELESDAGIPLQLATGQSAAVKLLIPSPLVSSAPATINTWSLDDRGVWKKEANNAVKNGNYYEWQASHFSYWNCDIPNSSIYLNLHVTDQNGQVLSNTYIDIKPTSANLWSSASGLTDSAGNATAFVPANEILKLSVYINRYTCNAPLYTQNIGPYTGNTNVNIAATINSPIPPVLVQGTAVNCNGAPVQAGTAIMYTSEVVYHTAIVNGSFSKTIYSCAPITIVHVVVLDQATQQQSSTTNVTISGNTANAGAISACGVAVDEYINYTVDGIGYLINSINGGYLDASVSSGVATIIHTTLGGGTVGIGFATAATAVGTFPVANDTMYINTFYNAIPAPSATITYTSYGTVGQYIEGNFNIPFTFNATGAHSCTGAFRVRRN